MPEVTDLATAQDETRRRVAAIGAEQWGGSTPCADWNVKDLVVHLVGGSRMAVRLLQGASENVDTNGRISRQMNIVQGSDSI